MAYAAMIALNYDWDVTNVYPTGSDELFAEMVKCKLAVEIKQLISKGRKEQIFNSFTRTECQKKAIVKSELQTIIQTMTVSSSTGASGGAGDDVEAVSVQQSRVGAAARTSRGRRHGAEPGGRQAVQRLPHQRLPRLHRGQAAADHPAALRRKSTQQLHVHIIPQQLVVHASHHSYMFLLLYSSFWYMYSKSWLQLWVISQHLAFIMCDL